MISESPIPHDLNAIYHLKLTDEVAFDALRKELRFREVDIVISGVYQVKRGVLKTS